MTDIYRKEWDATTMSVSDVMGELGSPRTIHHSHNKTGVGTANAELNFVLQLVRFFDRVINRTSETRVLYCGSHAHLVTAVLKYFPTLQLTVCPSVELTNPEQYRGWIVIYDYQINYRDVLVASLARRGLLLTDDSGAYVTAYQQAVEEAMVSHRLAVAEFLQQQLLVNKTLTPVLGLWRFTLPWQGKVAYDDHHQLSETGPEVVGMDGEIWPAIWGSANTSYAWLVTSSSSFPDRAAMVKIYRTDVFHAIMHYYNITLRSRFYQNPVSNDGQPPRYPSLDNSWDSWATVDVLSRLTTEQAKELLRTWPPDGSSETTTINDPFSG